MQLPPPNRSPLYQRTLGPAFDYLPPVLQRFHTRPTGAQARGTVRITRGPGRIRQFLATLMGLPSPGEAVPVTLQVQTIGDREQWLRQFDARRLASRQWLHDGLLMEAAGPMRLGFRLSADAQEMRMECVRCWLVGIPLPLALSPRINATAALYEEGWWLWVRIEAPLWGMVTQYEGKITLQE